MCDKLASFPGTQTYGRIELFECPFSTAQKRIKALMKGMAEAEGDEVHMVHSVRWFPWILSCVLLSDCVV